MHNRYNIKKWEEAGTKNIFVWKFFLDGNEIPGWKISGKNTRNDLKYIDCIEYYWENKASGEEAVKIDIYEYPSWKAAHENLLHMLENHMGAQLPEMNTEKNRLGDAAYSGSGKIQQHILFVRANMLVVVNSIGNKNISVTEIARIVDEQFYSRPHPSEKGVIPLIEKFSVFRQQNIVKGFEIIGIDIVAADPLNRQLWYKFYADQGEFFRENSHISFLSEKSRKNHVSVSVNNENGLSAQKTIELDEGNIAGDAGNILPEGPGV